MKMTCHLCVQEHMVLPVVDGWFLFQLKHIYIQLIVANKTYIHSMHKWYYMKFEKMKKLRCENVKINRMLSYLQNYLRYISQLSGSNDDFFLSWEGIVRHLKSHLKIRHQLMYSIAHTLIAVTFFFDEYI